VRARPPRSARVRSVMSRVAWGLGMGIRSEGRVLRFERGGCFRI
jgi:hypothetical protein